MKKWLHALVAALFLASLVTVPVGCGPGKATDIEATGDEPPMDPGHEEEAKNINKKGPND